MPLFALLVIALWFEAFSGYLYALQSNGKLLKRNTTWSTVATIATCDGEGMKSYEGKLYVASREDSGFSDIIVKTKKQLENAITLFKELMIRRRKKILNLVLIAAETGISKQDFDNMLEFEKELFEELMRCVEISDKKLDMSLNGAEAKKKNELLVFNERVEEFVGLDGEKMGPYDKGQIVNMPKEIAKILLDDGKVDLIE